MKNILSYSRVFLLFVAVLLLQCENNDNQLNNAVYLQEAEINNVTSIEVGKQGATFTITPRAVQKVKQDLSVSIAAAPELLDRYNKEQGIDFQALPAKYYSFSASSSTIKADEAIALPISIKLKGSASDLKGYVLPIKIIRVKSPVMFSSSILYLNINLRFFASLSGETCFHVPGFTEDSSVSNLSEFTMEARVKVNNFQPIFPKISSVMGIEGYCLLRFGDANLKPNNLQFAAHGFNVEDKSSFDQNQWYHIAVVVKNGVYTLYVNGEARASQSHKDNPTVDLSVKENYKGFWIGRSEGGRFLDGQIDEARVWRVARTPEQLKESEYAVDPKSEGLIAYWRFDEGTGNKAIDITGHGYDAISNQNVTWIMDRE